MAQDSGGHFEIQNSGIKLQVPDCYHTNVSYGDNKLAEKNMMTLCPSTGNENMVWLRHYVGV